MARGGGNRYILQCGGGDGGGGSHVSEVGRHIQTRRSTEPLSNTVIDQLSGQGERRLITPQIICCWEQIWDTIANFHFAQVLEVRARTLPPLHHPRSTYEHVSPNPCVFPPHFLGWVRGKESAPRRAVEVRRSRLRVMLFKCCVASVIFYYLSVILKSCFCLQVSVILPQCVIIERKKCAYPCDSFFVILFFSAQGFGYPIYVYCLLKYTWFFLRLRRKRSWELRSFV